MPVFDFSNTMSEKKEEGACTYTVRYSGGDAATVERPILLLDLSLIHISEPTRP